MDCHTPHIADAGTPVAATLAALEGVTIEYGRVVFASSLGAEDMVITDLIARHRLPVSIFTLDTGRLHGETYELLDRVREHYGVRIDVFHPHAAGLEAFTSEHGVNAFFRSRALREQCCHLRKVEPLRRALRGADAWITGLRRGQSAGRAEVPELEWDHANGLFKMNPLYDWSERDVWSYIRSQDVPYNPLHDRHFPSIGCAPCTRAVTPGEDVRAGRWWWENGDVRECGLHQACRRVA